MKLSPHSLIVLFLLLWSGLVLANETILLKNGDKVEGTIILEEADQVVMDVNVSASIIERKTFSMAEIEEIKRPSADELDFDPISNLQLGENSSTLPTYDRVLGEILDPFLLKHPESDLRPKVEEVRQAFFEERERVAAGEVKLEGRWLEADEVEKRRSEIDARVAFNTMRDAAARGDHIGALNAFDVIDRDFNGQLVYPDAVVLAQNSLRALSREVPRMIDAHAIELEEWKLGVERTRETRRQPLFDARAQEEASYDARLARATASGQRWPPLISRSIKSLEAIKGLADTESTKLQSVNVDMLRSSVTKTREALAFAEKKTFDRAEELVNDALASWPENAIAKNLLTELPALRTAHEEAIKAAIEAEEAAALEKAADAAAQEDAAAEQAEEAAAAQNQAALVTAQPEAQKKPFFMTIQGAIVIVVGVLVVVTGSAIVGKVRNKPSADTEA